MKHSIQHDDILGWRVINDERGMAIKDYIGLPGFIARWRAERLAKHMTEGVGGYTILHDQGVMEGSAWWSDIVVSDLFGREVKRYRCWPIPPMLQRLRAKRFIASKLTGV